MTSDEEIIATVPVYFGEQLVGYGDVREDKVIITIAKKDLTDQLPTLVEMGQIRGFDIGLKYVPAVEKSSE